MDCRYHRSHLIWLYILFLRLPIKKSGMNVQWILVFEKVIESWTIKVLVYANHAVLAENLEEISHYH